MSQNAMHMWANVGESLFVGPAGLGVTVSRGGSDRNKVVLRHHLSEDTRVVTARVLAEMFPSRISPDMPSQEDVQSFFNYHVYPALPEICPEIVAKALRLLDAASGKVASTTQPEKMNNLEFNRLYFVLRENCRAMINATLGSDSGVPDKGRAVQFHGWSTPETVVVGNRYLIRKVAEISESSFVVNRDRDRAARALSELKGLRAGGESRSFAFSHEALPDIMRIVEEFGVEDLLRKYGRLARRAVRR